jgi:hypothetical protein
MAITYPLSLPSQAGIARVTLRAVNVVALAQSPFTFQQQAFKHPGERWEAGVTLPAMARADAESWLAFLMALKGQTGTFLLGDPANGTPRGALAGSTVSVQVDGAVAAGTTAIPLKGLPVSTSGLLLPGDYIQLGAAGTATLHKVLLTLDSDGSGEGTAEVWPATRRALVTDEAVVYTSAVGRFRLASNGQDWQIGTDRNYAIQFDAVEAV